MMCLLIHYIFPFSSAAGSRAGESSDWIVLKSYDQNHLAKIALPIGGIGTGTVSLGGRGNLIDWEIMNRPAKGFIPVSGSAPFFCLFIHEHDGTKHARALEGPLEYFEYEGMMGSSVINHGLPRFRQCRFESSYPFGRVSLSDSALPVSAQLEAFNPLIPCDTDNSGIPIAVLSYAITNHSNLPLQAAVCGNIPNFIGNDGWEFARDWRGASYTVGEKANWNVFREGNAVQGLFMTSNGVHPSDEAWGTLSLTTHSDESVTYRTKWQGRNWGGDKLDFWDDFSDDGMLRERPSTYSNKPMGSLSVKKSIPAGETKIFHFFITWHFPNRMTWSPKPVDKSCCADTCDSGDPDNIGNYYTTKYEDAWDAAEKTIPDLETLHRETVQFVNSFCESDLPEMVREAALFNISTLRTQTCFRTPDGRFFGFEGCSDQRGCCIGSCTHVWNYEQATAFLFGDLARTMREVEFRYATDERGMMNFRVHLPLTRADEYGLAAADGQMGCIMKMYRDWQLSGDRKFLAELWPQVKKNLSFCWIPGGWDADMDGVMEGCQHNTMDVEYYGPNPQMGIWYLGALRAAEQMARYMKDEKFAGKCRKLFEQGSRWIDENLFNGEYYEHQIELPDDASAIARGLKHNMGAKNLENPDYQLGSGCLVDQLVGQYMAHICGLGYLTDPGHVRKTLTSVMKYNYKDNMHDHFNNMRSYVLGDESCLLMASYPKDRPQFPFPYFPEAMTGFEYTAAVGMLYEGQTENGLKCIRNIRNRYDGRKRSPFDEAECGHHYARAMANWAAVLAMTGFQYSGVDNSMRFDCGSGTYFWSNGYAWGQCKIDKKGGEAVVSLSVLKGRLELDVFGLVGFSTIRPAGKLIKQGESIEFTLQKGD